MTVAVAGGRGLTSAGELVAGKYVVERVLGSGGMGVVVAAVHRQLGTPVAIKFLFPRGAEREREIARSLNEARAAASITSPHVVRVFDVDVRADGVPFIVMELLAGETLAERLKTGPLGFAQAVDYVVEAAEALGAAHARGVVHRDLKPGNLFLANGGEHDESVKVLDFGIAKSLELGAPASAGTTGETFVGSPPYMSPEQLTEPNSVDARTDIWSLGAVLYECLTGGSPFTAQGVGEVCARVLQHNPAPIAGSRADVPPGLEAVVQRCLAKPRAQRHASMLELARALEPFGTDRARQALRMLELAAGRRSDQPASRLDPLAADVGPTAPLVSTETALATRASMGNPAGRGPRWAGAALAVSAVGGSFFVYVASNRHVAAGVSSAARSRSAPSALATARVVASAPAAHDPPSGASAVPLAASAARGPLALKPGLAARRDAREPRKP
ncbi:MAG TPA: protein kinase, partial [Polyangiaceae bacterium]|nr:protein kinase [Polyangiaceae bacterium]